MPFDPAVDIDRLPVEPGCYLMRAADDEIIYVGKAASLRARVRQYFGSTSDTRFFVGLLDRFLDRIGVREALEEERLALLEHGELGVLAQFGLHALHVREGGLAQSQRRRPAQGELPEPHAQAHTVLVIALEHALRHELLDEPVGGRARQPRAPTDLARGLHRAVAVERLEHAHDAGHHALAARRVRHGSTLPRGGSPHTGQSGGRPASVRRIGYARRTERAATLVP